MDALIPIVTVAVGLGLIPAAIAQRKGHDFLAWWIFGAALFVVALPAALLTGRREPGADDGWALRAPGTRGGGQQVRKETPSA